jgi:hypothetical protein
LLLPCPLLPHVRCPTMGIRVLAIALCSELAIALTCIMDVRCLALPTKVPALVAIRALVPGSLASCAVIFRGADEAMTDN